MTPSVRTSLCARAADARTASRTASAHAERPHARDPPHRPPPRKSLCPSRRGRYNDAARCSDRPPTILPEEPPVIGRTISHYRILEKLGEGGMGVVYKAEDMKLGRTVALKFLPPEMMRDSDANARFLQEARTAATLDHQNICTVYEIGEADGRTYIAMALIEGKSLRDRIRRGPLGLNETIDLAVQVAEGLAAAHRKGIVHRDMKPGNVMVTTEDQAKIMDFGLAKSPGQARLTKTGTTTGTVAYMSPEQSRGEDVDQRTDIWSFGVMLYEMVTGRLPFRGDRDQAVIRSILDDEPEPVTGIRTGVPIELERIVAKAMTKRLDERYQHVDDLLADLRSLRRELDSGTATVTTHAAASAAKPAGATAVWRWAIAAALVVIALVMVWNASRRGERASDLVASRMIVTAFENRTGDASLDAVGQMAGDTITDGLAQIAMVEVVPTPRVDDSNQEGAADDNVALARAASAGLVVSGAYYLEGNGLRFQASITDAERATVLHTVAAIGSRENPSEVVERLRERVLGAVAFRMDSGLLHGEAMTPPTYEAYREYSIGMTLFGSDYPAAIERFERATALDTTFMAPRTYIYFCHYNRGMYAEADSTLQTLTRRRAMLSPYEQQLTEYMAAKLRGDDAEALRALRLIAVLAPEDGLIKYLVGYTSLGLNRPREAADALEAANFRPVDTGFYVRSWRFGAWAEALHLLGEYRQELEVVRQGRERYPDIIWLRGHEAGALIALGRVDEMETLIDETLSHAGRYGSPASVMWHAAVELRVHVGREESIAMAERAVAWKLEELEGKSVADEWGNYLALVGMLYQTERWQDARELLTELASEKPDDLDVIRYLGVVAARLGDHEEARAVIERLRQLDRPYLFGENTFCAGCIAAQVGDREQAVRLLQQASARGYGDPGQLHYEMDFEPLHGYPPFEDLRRPKG